MNETDKNTPIGWGFTRVIYTDELSETVFKSLKRTDDLIQKCKKEGDLKRAFSLETRIISSASEEAYSCFSKTNSESHADWPNLVHHAGRILWAMRNKSERPNVSTDETLVWVLDLVEKLESK